MNAKCVHIINIKMKDDKVYAIVLTSDPWEIHSNHVMVSEFSQQLTEHPALQLRFAQGAGAKW